MSDDLDDEIKQLDRDFMDAWSALLDARAAYKRSPNGERLAFMQMAQRTADDLLELRHEMVTAERIVRA